MDYMKKYLNKFYEITNKIGKENFILVIFIFIALVSTGLYQTFSLYTESGGLSIVDGIETYSFILNASSTTNLVTIAPGNSKNIDITVANESVANLKYGVYYSTSNSINTNIGYLTSTKNLPKGNIYSNNDYVITIKVDNLSTSDITITFGLKYGFENSGELLLDNEQYWLDKYSAINKPNLDSGNLIPVYYDSTSETWKKADEKNLNNSWYDYENKMWANAVIISDDASVDYSSDSVAVGSTINNNDIVAFYVWIPRFKYRVWNINRQAKGENLTEFDADTYQENYYSYPAFSEGIEIEFETGIRNTGNVECVYDLTTIESVEVLSDKCYYNGEEITVNSNNKNYPNAWYTHPAFTFGDKEILGFWMSKYEVSGEKNEDGLGIQGTIKSIPDAQSLVIQTGSQQFSTAKLFQNYLTSNIDAHMTTSLEWGAVSYLAISKYGLCSDDGCEDVYINNSSSLYTGRSGGAVSGSDELQLSTVYSDATDSSKYNAYGYYNYQGYLIDYNTGNVSNNKDETKIASTTRNITGLYDMVGGAIDRTMGILVDQNSNLIESNAGIDWYGSTTLDFKYFTAYSYGTIGRTEQAGYNRARLGDATSEVAVSFSNSETIGNGWSVGHSMNGVNVYMVGVRDEDNIYSWQSRGASYSKAAGGGGIFATGRNQGAANTSDVYTYTFRSTLS